MADVAASDVDQADVAAVGAAQHSNSAPCNSAEAICIRGARVHNLQNIDLDILRDRFVVITGPSGSGKSSLAFDTLFAEGQRQYIESLSTYSRQFLHQMERPDVDLIEGLQPTISIDQRAGSHNPRSTVATVTEIYDYLRVLMARLGIPNCPQCGTQIRQRTPEEILDDLLEMPDGTKAVILAPMVRGRKGQHKDVLEAIRKAGFIRARVDGEMVDIDHVPELAPRKNHDIEAVVDRIIIREGIDDRLAESVNLAVRHGEGTVIVSTMQQAAEGGPQWQDELFSTLYACPNCKISFEEIEPRTFSFNSPYGACAVCEGLGTRLEFDPDLVFPNAELSLAEGAIAPWKGGGVAEEARHKKLLGAFIQAANVSAEAPIAGYKPAQRQMLLRGDGKNFAGILVELEKEYATATKEAQREKLESYRGQVRCAECGGSRLRLEGRSVRIAGKTIHEITSLSVSKVKEFFSQLSFREQDLPISQPITLEVGKRLEFLERVGLNYLTLDRSADTLSGGELQRVRLASGIGSGLVGVCYILDEPSIGLHPRDNDRLIGALRDLQSLGNTVLVVEHDDAVMREADVLIDMGPGAGRHGGKVVSQGTPAQVCADANSVTGEYLSGRKTIPLPKERRKVAKTRAIVLEGATANNLKNVSAWFPLSAFVCITGVSGSGKSSLLNETLARALWRRLGNVGPKPGPHTSLRGVNQIDKMVEIDQSPIGRSPRSNPATYTGIFDEIRKVFAGTREAKQRGYKTGRFSFNVKGGRCEECQGQGMQKIEMNFLPDLYVKCPVCEGRRFNDQTLQVQYKGKNIAEVLDMRVDDAVSFFENFPVIHRLVKSLQQVGLGYLTLGQSSTTLSGGEAQRVKLAAELGRVDTGNTLYLLDEPTTGLHFDDIRKLLEVLSRLVDLGNTVIVIEHNLDVMKCADWIIDMGPEGGAGGGEIIAVGTPEDIAATAGNQTGLHLRPLLDRSVPD